jgi:hypothetical protein
MPYGKHQSAPTKTKQKPRSNLAGDFAPEGYPYQPNACPNSRWV